ncbi:hypothetical protein PR048_022870 [Dryococelus australis]|uniref:Uncharacterized protein n=1 Tax=Dryococelus australis TaxID=614101 RepID=A0ABQ9GSJ6_9NEOP|nr:hypothetical protein PR048_022870 [Dryococelus australis]
MDVYDEKTPQPIRVVEVGGTKGRGKQEIPEKTRRPAASSGTIPACENPGVTRGRSLQLIFCFQWDYVVSLEIPSPRLKQRDRNKICLTPCPGNSVRARRSACEYPSILTSGARFGEQGNSRLGSLVYKYADINCTLVVCCHGGRRQLDTVLKEVSNTFFFKTTPSPRGEGGFRLWLRNVSICSGISINQPESTSPPPRLPFEDQKAQPFPRPLIKLEDYCVEDATMSPGSRELQAGSFCGFQTASRGTLKLKEQLLRVYIFLGAALNSKVLRADGDEAR